MALGEIVSANLRSVRQNQGLSQETVARKAGISVSYISMLERGERTTPLDTLEALAKALGVSPLYLLQELEGNPKSRRRR
ncbi:MAG: helix-turn-helix transcriptional regulator [Deltaproteobacteria bacterium]|nr:helix-turn-helix transcriptional regulator [Deltaproteobacteria bacterium]